MRFYFKDGILDEIYKIKYSFVILKISRKRIKKFKKVIKYYLNFFLKNNEELFEKMCSFKEDKNLNCWCIQIMECHENKLNDLIKKECKERNNLIKIRKIYL